MSITAAPDKRTLASTLFTTYTLIIALVGAALLYLGFTGETFGGSLFYPLLGLALVVSGGLLFRRHRSGLWLFGLASLATWIWGMLANAVPDSTDAQPSLSIASVYLPPLSSPAMLLACMAVLGLILLAFWPVARKRLVGVAKPGYFIINGALPLAMILTIAATRLSM